MYRPESPLKIYEFLPKKNCGECGVKTCMAFALRLMEGTAEPSECPYLNEDCRIELEALVSPPVRKVRLVGSGRTVTIGGERVLHRHESKFYYPTALAVELSDLEDVSTLNRVLKEAATFSLDMGGEELRIDAVAIRGESGDDESFSTASKLASEEFTGPLILCSYDPKSTVNSLDVVKGRPLIYAAKPETLDDFISIALEKHCPLAVEMEDLGIIRSMVRRAMDSKVEVVISPGTSMKNPYTTLRNFIQIRRGAIQHGIDEFRFPIIGVPAVAWREFGDPGEAKLWESLGSSMLIMRYADILVIRSTSIESLLPVCTLRRAIYSDPRVPASVKPDLYTFGEPDDNSPVLLTTNYALTFYMVSGDLHRSRIGCYLIVLDTGGMSVLNALAGRLLAPRSILDFIKKHRLEETVKNRRLIIPRGLSVLSGDIEDATGWKVMVGPEDSSELPRFLRMLG